MKIKLVPRMNKSQVELVIRERLERIENAIFFNLQRIGEEFVNYCRTLKTYKDRTGNLRSSIGYVILKNGEQIFENFKTVSGGDAGVEQARVAIDAIKGTFPTGYVLIGVAGMQYAAAVESRGYDVISMGAIKAENALRVAMKRITKKIAA